MELVVNPPEFSAFIRRFFDAFEAYERSLIFNNSFVASRLRRTVP
jgi:hypothetical protein